MTVTRRFFTMGAIAGLAAGCRAGPGRMTAATVPEDPGLQPQANPGYDAWVASFRERAEAAGISRATLDAAFRGAGYLPGVVERDRNQTEFTRTTEDYLAIVASEEKVARGRAAFAQHGAILGEIEERFGVPPEIVAAIWGVESQFGTRRGDIPVISATSTLAFDGRRGAFFESQLLATLRILERGDTTPARLTGSWAGAMGHTQFIPTTYQSYAVDFRGDGKRDIWSDDPTDALASAAAYLAKSGWTGGRRWGLEIVAPEGFDAALAGRGKGRAVSEWAAMGVRPAAGGSLPDHGAASVLLPAGPDGPAFMIFSNFNVLLRYNNSENYALGVGYLSDRLAGGGPLRGRFPPDDNGLTIDDRKEIQRRLTARGYDTGGADGVMGKKSEAAIRDWQAAQGVAVTGRPSRGLLAALGGGG